MSLASLEELDVLGAFAGPTTKVEIGQAVGVFKIDVWPAQGPPGPPGPGGGIDGGIDGGAPGTIFPDDGDTTPPPGDSTIDGGTASSSPSSEYDGGYAEPVLDGGTASSTIFSGDYDGGTA